MRKNIKIKAVERIIDANINRAKEGLRVCEEIIRFVLNSKTLTKEFKKIRHLINATVKKGYSVKHLAQSRNSGQDVGQRIYINELSRSGVRDIFFANMQRVKESIRTLEEFSKLKNINLAVSFKNIRYKIYSLEKKAIKRIF